MLNLSSNLFRANIDLFFKQSQSTFSKNHILSHLIPNATFRILFFYTFKPFFFFFFPLVMEINPIGATYCPFWREKLDLSAPLNVNQSLTTTLRILLYYEYLSQLF